MREVGGRGRSRVPAVKETVVLETAATEEGLVGVQGLGACQWRYVGTAGERVREREGEREREGGRGRERVRAREGEREGGREGGRG